MSVENNGVGAVAPKLFLSMLLGLSACADAPPGSEHEGTAAEIDSTDARGDGEEDSDAGVLDEKAVGKVQFISSSTAVGDHSSPSVARPAGVQAGDLLVLFVTAGGGNVSGTQAGWTRAARCFESDNAQTTCEDRGPDLNAQFFYKVASASEPGSYRVDSLANHTLVTVMVLRGADTTRPIFASGELANDHNANSSACPSATGISDGLLICGLGHDDNQQLKAASGMTMRVAKIFAGDAHHVATQPLTSNVATGRKVFQNNGAVDGGNNDISLSLVVRPR